MGFLGLTLGILHGANDLKIISKSFKGELNNLYFKSIVVYILVVLLGVVFFFNLPGLALIIFVLFSSYHFGEEHWEDRLSISASNFALYSLYGAFIFFLMFTLQYVSVVKVIEKISGHHWILNFSFTLPLYWGAVYLQVCCSIPPCVHTLLKSVSCSYLWQASFMLAHCFLLLLFIL